MFIIIYPYRCLLFCVFIFTFFFLLFSPRDKFYNLECLIRFHYNLLVTSRNTIKNNPESITEKKSVTFIITELNALIFSWYKVSFSPSLSTCFLLSFWPGCSLFSHHILMKILSMNYYNYFGTKKYVNNISYRKLSLNSEAPTRAVL